jgi:hypothetical protein
MRISESYFQSLLTNTVPDEAVFSFVNIWSGRTSLDRTIPYFGLGRKEYLVQLVVQYDGEVGNGGHFQYLSNPSGGNAREAILALRELGFEERAELLEAALEPVSIESGIEHFADLVESANTEVMKFWGTLDRAYFELPFDVNSRILEYLRANSSEILVKEREA